MFSCELHDFVEGFNGVVSSDWIAFCVAYMVVCCHENANCVCPGWLWHVRSSMEVRGGTARGFSSPSSSWHFSQSREYVCPETAGLLLSVLSVIRREMRIRWLTCPSMSSVVSSRPGVVADDRQTPTQSKLPRLIPLDSHAISMLSHCRQNTNKFPFPQRPRIHSPHHPPLHLLPKRELLRC